MEKQREIYWVIIVWQNGKKMYFPGEYDELRELWETDPYAAHKFLSEEQAEDYLLEGFYKKYWGGIFQIEKVYINR